MPESDRRAARIAADLCATCGQEAPEPGRLSCSACLERGRALAEERHRRLAKAGTCVQCGAHPAVPGGRRCEACAEKQRARMSLGHG